MLGINDTPEATADLKDPKPLEQRVTELEARILALETMLENAVTAAVDRFESRLTLEPTAEDVEKAQELLDDAIPEPIFDPGPCPANDPNCKIHGKAK